MAKPLGLKSVVIREAIKANPGMGNTELADLINDSQDRLDDKLEVKAAEVAKQKEALKNLGEPVAATPAPAEAVASKPAAKKGNGRRKGGRKKATATASPATPRQAAPVARRDNGDMLEIAKQVKQLCDRFGADTVKGLADLFGK